MTRTQSGKLTYADYAKIPEDGHRHEIIAGEEIMTPSPDVPHQRISRKLEYVLHSHVTSNALGEVFYAPMDVLLGEHDVVQPDILFVSNARASSITEKNIQGAPDLVVEILSPSTAAIDRGPKLALYERSGVVEYWIVDPVEKTVELRELTSPRRVRIYKEGQSFSSALFPGLTMRLEDIF